MNNPIPPNFLLIPILLAFLDILAFLDNLENLENLENLSTPSSLNSSKAALNRGEASLGSKALNHAVGVPPPSTRSLFFSIFLRSHFRFWKEREAFRQEGVAEIEN